MPPLLLQSWTLHFLLFSGVDVFFREEEAKRQCDEAEQKLREERQRSVSLEQQLEKARLLSTPQRSTTGLQRALRTGYGPENT